MSDEIFISQTTVSDQIFVTENPIQNIIQIDTSGNFVLSVNGKIGVVVLNKEDIGLNFVDNTSDLDKPLSISTLSALSAKVNSSDFLTLLSFLSTNSTYWDSVFSNVNSNSAKWEYAYNTAINTLSSQLWNNTYTTVQLNSATNWNYQGYDLKDLSATWVGGNEAYTNLISNSSAYLSSVDLSFLSVSGNWDSSYTTVNYLSSYWNSVYSNVSSNSAIWSVEDRLTSGSYQVILSEDSRLNIPGVLTVPNLSGGKIITVSPFDDIQGFYGQSNIPILQNGVGGTINISNQGVVTVSNQGRDYADGIAIIGGGTRVLISVTPFGWVFNSDGSITFPDNTTQTTAFTGVTIPPSDRLNNGTVQVVLSSDNLLHFPTGIIGDTLQDGGFTILGKPGSYAELASNDGNVYAWASDTNYGNPVGGGFSIGTAASSSGGYTWTFGNDGLLHFPDGSIQPTAFLNNLDLYASLNYVDNNFLNLSGGLVSGPVRINNNLTVFGNLTASGTTTFANTIFSTTSSLSVVHIGSGPALWVGNNGDGDIASFYDIDSNVEILHVGGNNGTFPNVGVKTSEPNVDFTVNGQISANNIIWDANGNSNNWNSAFNISTAYQNTSGSFATNTLLQSTSALLTPLTLTRTLTGQLVLNTDSRLSDARTPTAHAYTHGQTGDDSIAVPLISLDTIQIVEGSNLIPIGFIGRTNDFNGFPQWRGSTLNGYNFLIAYRFMVDNKWVLCGEFYDSETNEYSPDFGTIYAVSTTNDLYPWGGFFSADIKQYTNGIKLRSGAFGTSYLDQYGSRGSAETYPISDHTHPLPTAQQIGATSQTDFNNYRTSVAATTATLLPTTIYQNTSGSFATNTLLESTSALLTPLTLTRTLTGQLVLNTAINSLTGNWNSTFTTLCANSATWVKFQPNPEYLADDISDAAYNNNRYNRYYDAYYGFGDFNPYYWIKKFSGETVWKIGYTECGSEDCNDYVTATSLTNATYPWEATWSFGTLVEKASAIRVIGQPLAVTGTEGTSQWAARADHRHPYPTYTQVGAAAAVHTHPISQVINLQSSLDSKATLNPEEKINNQVEFIFAITETGSYREAFLFLQSDPFVPAGLNRNPYQLLGEACYNREFFYGYIVSTTIAVALGWDGAKWILRSTNTDFNADATSTADFPWLCTFSNDITIDTGNPVSIAPTLTIGEIPDSGTSNYAALADHQHTLPYQSPDNNHQNIFVTVPSFTYYNGSDTIPLNLQQFNVLYDGYWPVRLNRKVQYNYGFTYSGGGEDPSVLNNFNLSWTINGSISAWKIVYTTDNQMGYTTTTVVASSLNDTTYPWEAIWTPSTVITRQYSITPLAPSLTGSAGISDYISRADHTHPAQLLSLSGNNLSITNGNIVSLSSFVTDAPSNGIQYARKNGAWTAVVTTSGGGSGGSAYSIVDANFSALVNQKYLVDTTSISIVGTLPDSPALGDNILFVDSYNNWGSSPLILNNNGNLLQTFNEPLTANISGYQFQLVYVGGLYGWKIV